MIEYNRLHFLEHHEWENLQQGCVVTINMQHLYEAYFKPSIRETIFQNPLTRYTIDGRGAAKLFARHCGVRSVLEPGNEMVRILLQASGPEDRILIIGSTEAVIESLRCKFPALLLDHCDDRIPLEESHAAARRAEALRSRYPLNYRRVFIALGTPKGECLAHSLAPLFECPVYCIGGSFEIITEFLPRAHPMLQRAGLEGVWRFITQPNFMRLKRMLLSYSFFTLMYFSSAAFFRSLGKRPRC